MSKKAGFSLMELLAVVAIIAVLFSIGLAAYSRLFTTELLVKYLGAQELIDGQRRVGLEVIEGEHKGKELRCIASDSLLKEFEVYPHGPHGKRLYVRLDATQTSIALKASVNNQPLLRIKGFRER